MVELVTVSLNRLSGLPTATLDALYFKIETFDKLQ